MFRFITRPNRAITAFAMLAMLCATAAAAAERNNAPITITADSAQLSRANNVSSYSGNVVLKRGGLTLTGNKLVVKKLDDGTFRAELTGGPAHLKRTPTSANEQPITGHAQRVVYTSANAQIVLRGDAIIKRNGDTIRSEIIRHDLDTRRTVAEGTEQGDNRVQITLHPDSESDSGQQP